MLSRIAKMPLEIPNGVEVTINEASIIVKGVLGQLEYNLSNIVTVNKENNTITLSTNENSKFAKAMSGTVRALINNMLVGVSQGFEKKLNIIGVGYRATLQGEKLNLALGFSHPVVYEIDSGIKIELPTANEIVVKGIDKQLVGQVAAVIRSYRKVEPYKGKGIRYANERVILKETKKK